MSFSVDMLLMVSVPAVTVADGGNSTTAERPATAVGPFTCIICAAVFVDRADLSRHRTRPCYSEAAHAAAECARGRKDLVGESKYR